jgi:hypothetical protein
MPEFLHLPIFAPLSPELAEWMIALIRDRLTVTNGPAEAYDLVGEAIERRGRPVSFLPLPEQARLGRWFQAAPAREMLETIAVIAGLAPAPAPVRSRFKPATPDQLALIREAQVKLEMDFTPMFDSMSAWQADSVLKGLIVVSEVLQQTGDRHFHPRDLRLAVRRYLIDHPEAAGGRRPRPSNRA